MNRTGTLLALALTTTVALTACSSSDGGDSATAERGTSSQERLEDRPGSAEAPQAAPSEAPDGSDAAGGSSGSTGEAPPDSPPPSSPRR
ncbi:hypothetical protein [Nocardioides zeae]